LPLDLAKNEHPTCNISRGSAKGQLLQDTQLIIWDEATMSHKGAFEALDRSLQDLRHNNSLMGGLTVLLAGDFRQTLPVIPRGTRADEVKACLKSSYLWPKVSTANYHYAELQYTYIFQVLRLSLTRNMRVHLTGDENAAQFAKQLLQLGNGKLPLKNDQVSLPFGNQVNTPQSIVEQVFPCLQERFTNREWLSERAILAPRNAEVDAINEELLTILPGISKTYTSINSIIDPDEIVHYPTEFLNSLQIPGLPPHHLNLKVGAPIMLLRNLKPPKLCNGTRLTIKKKKMTHAIEATIMTGIHKGEDVFIPKIPLMPSDTPFNFKRLRVSFFPPTTY
jgi:ATP-dependent DNA helicase PIF1